MLYNTGLGTAWDNWANGNTNSGELYSINGNTEDTFDVSADSVLGGVWDALAIYGQYRAIDAQYDEQPAPNNEIVEKNDEGNYLAGSPFANSSSTSIILWFILALLLSATAYQVVKS